MLEVQTDKWQFCANENTINTECVRKYSSTSNWQVALCECKEALRWSSHAAL